MLKILATLFFLTWISPVHGDVRTLEKQWSLLDAHRSRLEGLLSHQVKRIQRLKRKGGVRRDFQLKQALRQNQELARRLNQLQPRLRTLRTTLLKAYNHALRNTKDKAHRLELLKQRNKLQKTLPQTPKRIVVPDKVNPLDSPEDLEEKADLLKDSAGKIKKQLRVLQSQIKRFKHRAKLKRFGRSVDDSPFVEASPRRLAKSKSSASKLRSESNPKTAPEQQTGSPENNKFGNHLGGSPAPKTPPPPGYSSSDSGGSGNRAQLNLSIRGIMDPSLLKELRKAQKSGDFKQRLKALVKAQKRLEKLAQKLNKRAKQLRKRAKGMQ